MFFSSVSAKIQFLTSPLICFSLRPKIDFLLDRVDFNVVADVVVVVVVVIGVVDAVVFDIDVVQVLDVVVTVIVATVVDVIVAFAVVTVFLFIVTAVAVLMTSKSRCRLFYPPSPVHCLLPLQTATLNDLLRMRVSPTRSKVLEGRI